MAGAFSRLVREAPGDFLPSAQVAAQVSQENSLGESEGESHEMAERAFLQGEYAGTISGPYTALSLFRGMSGDGIKPHCLKPHKEGPGASAQGSAPQKCCN